MDITNKRKKFSAEQKVRILRLHLIEKDPVSDVCDKHGLRPEPKCVLPLAKTVF